MRRRQNRTGTRGREIEKEGAKRHGEQGPDISGLKLKKGQNREEVLEIQSGGSVSLARTKIEGHRK
jgi:hypothetical protein